VIRFLRRHQPAHPALAAGYWLAVSAAAAAALLAAFTALDRLLPGAGML
jgi:hypothetical protein